MKIDLHIHTKKCKQGDNSKRNIGPEDFIRKMRENEVGIAAITNHNHFDIEAYEEIIAKDPELLIFPGMEIDVKDEEGHYHIIIICDPEKRKEFYSVFDDDSSRDYDDFNLSYGDFIQSVKKFKAEDIIIIPHFLKDKKRSINKEMKDQLKKDLVYYLVILEPGRIQTMGVINAHDELSLIGSDVTNWDEYDKYELPEIKFRISSFKKFYELAGDPALFISRYLRESPKYTMEIEIEERTLNNALDIYKDVNIIFGEKGSGKTILLKDHIYPFLRDKGLKTFLHEGKDYNKNYEDLIRSFEKSVLINEDLLKNIESNFQFISDYIEETPSNSIDKLKAYHSNINANKNSKLIKKLDSQYSNDSFESFEVIIDKFERDLNKIKEVEKINRKIRKSIENSKILLSEQLEVLEKDLVTKTTQEYKKIFVDRNTEEFLTKLKSSVEKKTGRESKPNNIGFSKLVSQRLSRIEANENIKQDLIDIQESKRHILGNIPIKGRVNITTSIEVLAEDENYLEKGIFGRKHVIRNKAIIKKIKHFNYKEFKNINDFFELDEKISSSEFTSEMIKKRSIITLDEGQEYTPSEGEKAILTISGLLENESYDCYLFDEIERGLGQKYITDYIVPKIKDQRDRGKIVVVSTHNSNIAINTLPSQTIYCNYNLQDDEYYYQGNLYTNTLIGIEHGEKLVWKDKAMIHLEGSKEMFGKRRNTYGV